MPRSGEPTERQDDSVSRAELRESTLRGLPWYAGARAVTEVAGVLSSVALARLLTPAEIGRAVLALACAGVAMSVFGEGFTTALTQRRETDERTYESSAFASLGFGVALTLVTATAGAALAGAVVDATAEGYIRLASPMFLLAAVGVVPRARLQRSLAFRRLGVLDTSGAILAVATTVLVAALGWDGRSIIAGQLVATAVVVILLHVAARGALPRLHRRELVDLGRFGLPAGLSSLIYTGFRNVDYAVIGALLSPRSVGIYYRAYTLGYEYQGKVSGIMLRMALPIYARTEDREHMRAIRTRIVRAHATALFPLLALLGVVAPTFVPWFFGDQWEAAVVPTQILAFAGAGAAVLSGTGPLIFALGRVDAMLRWNVWTLCFYTAVVAGTAPFGLIAVCVGVAAFQVVNFVSASLLLTQRIAGIPFRQSLVEIAPAAVGSLAMAPVAWATLAGLSALDVPTVIALAVTGLCGGAVYTLVLRRASPAAFGDLETLVRSVLPALGRLRRRRGRLPVAEPITDLDA